MKFRRSFLKFAVAALSIGVGSGLFGPHGLRAERPAAQILLPEETLAFVHIADVPEFVEKFKNSNMGKMFRDPQLQPLVEQVYGSATNAFQGAEDEVGLSLTKILKIPQGEVALAIVAPEDSPPAFVLILDTGDQLESAQKLLRKLTSELDKQSKRKTTEMVEGTEFIIYDVATDGPFRKMVFFEKDNTIIASTTLDMAHQLFDRWNTEDTKERIKTSLSKNIRYSAIMKTCKGRKDPDPQVTIFVEPIELVKVFNRDNTAFQLILATALPKLGLDGLAGIGATMTFDAKGFDSVAQLHILINNPRKGIMKMLALQPGEITPPKWVPHDVDTYSTFNWDIQKTFDLVVEMIESFQGEGKFTDQLEKNINEPLEIDYQKDVLDQLTGRISYVSWFDSPPRLGSQARMVAIEVKDPEVIKGVMAKVVEKMGPKKVLEKKISDITYYEIPVRRPLVTVRRTTKDSKGNPVQPPQRAQLSPLVVQPTPCFAMIDNVFVLSSNTNLMIKIIGNRSDGAKSLKDDPRFKIIAASARRVAGRNKPSLLLYQNPESTMKYLYDLISDEEFKKELEKNSTGNPFLTDMKKSLEENPLPPFSVLSRYMTPSGAVVFNTPNGFHFTSFALKRKGE